MFVKHPRYLCCLILVALIFQNKTLLSQENREDYRRKIANSISENQKEAIKRLVKTEHLRQYLSWSEQLLLAIYAEQYPEALNLFLNKAALIFSEIEHPVQDSVEHFVTLLAEKILQERKLIDKSMELSSIDAETVLFLKIVYRAIAAGFVENDNMDYRSYVDEYLTYYPYGRFVGWVRQYFLPQTKQPAGIYGYSTSIGVAGVIPSKDFSGFFKTKAALQFDFDYHYHRFLFGLSATNFYSSLQSDIPLTNNAVWQVNSDANHFSLAMNAGYRHTFSDKTIGFVRGGFMLGWIYPTTNDTKKQHLPDDYLIKSHGGKITAGVVYYFKYRDVDTFIPGYRNRLQYGICVQYSFLFEKFSAIITNPVWMNSIGIALYFGAQNL